MFLPNMNRMQATEITHPRQRWNGAFCCCVTLFAVSMYHSIAAGGMGVHSAFFVPGDLDL